MQSSGDILFVHIPKNAGKSIFSVIDDKWKRSNEFNHDPLFSLEMMNNIPPFTFKFCICRNPFTRTFSYYKHFIKWNQYCSHFTFYDFLYHIKKKIIFDITPMILYPQSFYIYNLKGEIGVKIFRYEKLREVEKIVGKIPVLNNGIYDREEYNYHYAQNNNIEVVRELFFVDFQTFNYSMDFS